MSNSKGPREQAVSIFLESGGTLRMSEALRKGISRHTLYSLVDEGTIERLSRGLYRLTSLGPVADPDLVTVAERIPDGVICLISALAFHQLTTQIPHAVWVAIPRGNWEPQLDWPPIRVMEFGKHAHEAGIESHELDGTTVNVYSREKTLADCFKYRNKIGPDVALEALATYLRADDTDLNAVFRYARVCRVVNVMRPYLDGMLYARS
jgi:predicted transcriptional regulator of viral defense system